MASYLTELHAHTKESSSCATLSAHEVAERYIAEGYSTVVVTNHYNSYNLDFGGDTWEGQINHHLAGYRAMKEYAKDRLCVLLGSELRFTDGNNDYLVLGLDEEFLISHPNLHLLGLKAFSSMARLHGLLLIQAHPFRNGMTVVRPEYLDGIEVFNGSAEHHSRNNIAKEWAKKYGLLPTSGSDFHIPTHFGCGGIVTTDPIRSNEELLSVLRGGDYTLRCAGPAAERDGMSDMPAKY